MEFASFKIERNRSLIGCHGTVIGGALAKPASRYPNVFGSVPFFEEFPFALPNLVCAFLALLGTLVGFLFLQETAGRVKGRRDRGLILGSKITSCFKRAASPNDIQKERAPLLGQSSASTDDSQAQGENGEPTVSVDSPQPQWKEVFNKQSCLNLVVYGLLAMHSVAFDQLLPIFLHYPQLKNRSSDLNVHLPFKFTGGKHRSPNNNFVAFLPVLDPI